MVFRKKYSKRSYSRPRVYKRYGKKYGRRRWKSKKFVKSTATSSTIRPPLASRNLYVKLPYSRVFATSIGTSSAQSYVFTGNALVPYTAAASGNPAAGDVLPGGLIQYGQFYNDAVAFGSSFKCQIMAPSTAVNSLLRCVLITMPFRDGVIGGSDQDRSAVITQLDSYTYEQLIAWPYASWKTLSIGSGGSPTVYFKKFRKTKSMLGVKDVVDGPEFRMDMPQTTADLAGDPSEGFIWYLRIFNRSTTDAIVPEVVVKMSTYLKMSTREFNQQLPQE